MKWMIGIVVVGILTFCVPGTLASAQQIGTAQAAQSLDAYIRDLTAIETQLEAAISQILSCTAAITASRANTVRLIVEARTAGDLERVIDMLVAAEQENLRHERCLYASCVAFLAAEEKYLSIKAAVLRYAFQTHLRVKTYGPKEVGLILLVLKVEEEIAFGKALMAEGWLSSSILEQRLTLEKKKSFLQWMANIKVP